jgi:beta-phosphoglucomutase-like phosphatase (HAD superfamily)
MDFSQFKGVIFDLDGTLVESHGVWEQIDIDFLGERGFEVPADYGKVVSAMDFQQAAVYTKQRFSLDESIGQICQCWRDMAIWHYTNDISAVSGAVDFVRSLHCGGTKLALATASSSELYEPVLRRHGILDCFDFFATTKDVERGKGFPDIYDKSCSKMGIDKNKTIVFEDILEAIKGAKDGGYTVIAMEDEVSLGDKVNIKKISDGYIKDFREMIN